MNDFKQGLDNSPLTAEQTEQLQRLLETLSPTQAAWINGYLAGVQQSMGEPATTDTAAPALTVLYGSETGNSEELAEQVAARGREQGFAVQVTDMAEYKHKQLRQEQHLLVITSTHGEGDPPEPAQDFFEYLFSKKAPKLEGLPYAVLALGDLSYEHFCQAGRDVDERLAELGGQRLYQRVECDVDYDEPAAGWIDGVLGTLEEQAGSSTTTAITATPGSQPATAYTRKNPLATTILDNILLSGRGSQKEVRHIELSVADSGLTWEPGDALGVIPSNVPEEVDELIERLGFAADTPVSGADGEDKPLREALLHDYEITTLNRPLLEKYAEFARSDELAALMGDDHRADLAQYMADHHLIDVVQSYPPNTDAATFVGILRRLPPRLYSIASSQRAIPDEVHILVDVVRYESHGRQRQGVASTLLAERVNEDDTIDVYVDRNKNFKLPDNPDTPIIMIGPGTGVAPFRAFLQEREETDAGGHNWLLFGDQHFRSDFLYQTEWLRWRRSGLLSRIDVAFSRDQTDKVYVQHRLREHAADIYAWIESGAHVYVCGDAKRMAPDVHQALVDIICEQGGLESTQAEDRLKQLQKNRRYQRDVY